MTLERMYGGQKVKARIRGITWKLTFNQWLRIWLKSGKLEQRGRGRGKYVMARYRDRGPYAVGNVQIITHEQNCCDRRASLETRRKISEGGKGLKRSIETRRAISQAMKGRIFSAETLHRMSLGQKRRQVREHTV